MSSPDSFVTYCKEKQPYCKEPGVMSDSKVCYWCYRGYHHATQHMKDKIRDALRNVIDDNQDCPT
jgi:hypothetical protein